ncbi:hypothetical protein ACIHAA_07315 [Streptomyces sp. NPDC052040]|uniref:hypothetical protein n=1 Tax=Streptomyces sp. NPDC052040 TaxID=3365682 RepID=UPI0037D0F7EE
MAASVHPPLPALSKRVPAGRLPATGRFAEPDPLLCVLSAEVACAEVPLTSEPPLPDAEPLTSEPPLADATPLTSEPPAAHPDPTEF